MDILEFFAIRVLRALMKFLGDPDTTQHSLEAVVNILDLLAIVDSVQGQHTLHIEDGFKVNFCTLPIQIPAIKAELYTLH